VKCRIIRPQAVVETITNRTARALEMIAQQLSQTEAVAYRHHRALDYLLTSEGGLRKI
ncbi:ENR1 protein, partial [Chunga burmeisteri]|nr:ENR1 protein [Chunga burmeisteri]